MRDANYFNAKQTKIHAKNAKFRLTFFANFREFRADFSEFRIEKHQLLTLFTPNPPIKP